MVTLVCAIVGAEGSAFPVDIEASRLVGDLKKAIKADNSATITCDAKELQLFLAKKGDVWLPDDDPAALELDDGKTHQDIQTVIDGEKMKATWTIEDVLIANNMIKREGRAPKSRQIHVLVVVSGEPNQVAKDTRSARTHSENRRKRWRELNEILDKNKKAKTNGDDGSSTGSSYVRWSEVKSVLDYERYKQERKPIPDHAFDFLIKYLKYAAEAMNGYTDASREAKRCHFIAPV